MAIRLARRHGGRAKPPRASGQMRVRLTWSRDDRRVASLDSRDPKMTGRFHYTPTHAEYRICPQG